MYPKEKIVRQALRDGKITRKVARELDLSNTKKKRLMQEIRCMSPQPANYEELVLELEQLRAEVEALYEERAAFV